MIRMTQTLAGLACLVTLLAPLPALSQGAPPPDPLWIRMNGTEKLTQVVLPLVAQKSGKTHQEIDKVWIMNAYPATVSGIGANVSTWLSDIELDVPIDGNDITAKFMPASGANRGRLLTWFDLADATLKFKFHVFTRPRVPQKDIQAALPQWLNLNETFSIEIKRLHGGIDYTLRQMGAGIQIESFGGYFVQVGSVFVSDSGYLIEIANAVLGLDRLFNVTGAANANQAATKVANHLLATDLGLDDLLVSLVNSALAATTTQQFPLQSLPMQPAGLMQFTPALAGIATVDNFGASGWAVALDAKPDGKVPDLVYTKQSRSPENVMQTPAAGDVQVYVPYTMLEQIMFEMIQAGLTRDIPVPDVDGGGPQRAFTLNLLPTSVPRVRPDPASPPNLLIEFSSVMEDAKVGTVTPSVTSGPYPTPANPLGPARPIDILTMNASASVRIHTRLGADASSGLFLSVLRVDLLDLTGQLQFSTATTSVVPYRVQIQNAINAGIVANGGNRIPLIPRTMTLMEGLTTTLGSPTPGTMFVRAPLTIVPTLQRITLPGVKPVNKN